MSKPHDLYDVLYARIAELEADNNRLDVLAEQEVERVAACYRRIAELEADEKELAALSFKQQVRIAELEAERDAAMQRIEKYQVATIQLVDQRNELEAALELFAKIADAYDSPDALVTVEIEEWKLACRHARSLLRARPAP